MKSASELWLTAYKEMENSYLNLFDCHVLHEKALNEHLGDKCGLICSYTDMVSAWIGKACRISSG